MPFEFEDFPPSSTGGRFSKPKGVAKRYPLRDGVLKRHPIGVGRQRSRLNGRTFWSPVRAWRLSNRGGYRIVTPLPPGHAQGQGYPLRNTPLSVRPGHWRPRNAFLRSTFDVSRERYRHNGHIFAPSAPAARFSSHLPSLGERLHPDVHELALPGRRGRSGRFRHQRGDRLLRVDLLTSDRRTNRLSEGAGLHLYGLESDVVHGAMLGALGERRVTGVVRPAFLQEAALEVLTPSRNATPPN